MHLFNQLSNSGFLQLILVFHQYRPAFVPVFFWHRFNYESWQSREAVWMIVYSCRWMQNGFPNPKIERSHLHPSQAKKQRPETPSIDSEASLKGEWVVWWGIVASRVTKRSCWTNFVSWEERGHNFDCESAWVSFFYIEIFSRYQRLKVKELNYI